MHESVLLEECINGLNIKSDGVYVDATVGYAGHSSVILKKLKRGFLFAFDQDDEALKHSDERLSKISNNFKLIHSNFSHMLEYIEENSVDGVLFDLGVSSPELDDASRGFSYNKDNKLDMRMDKRNELTAYYVVNNYTLEELTNIFFKYGEEKYSKSIAKAIIKRREDKPIETTLELSEIIKDNVPISYRNKKHPARKVFQALRIEVNNELDILRQSMLDAFSVLKPGGRLCVITFHSLEDKIVKQVFKELTEDDVLSKGLPFVPEDMKRKANKINKSVIIPSEEELNKNNRSRSAKLRIIEKI